MLWVEAWFLSIPKTFWSNCVLTSSLTPAHSVVWVNICSFHTLESMYSCAQALCILPTVYWVRNTAYEILNTACLSSIWSIWQSQAMYGMCLHMTYDYLHMTGGGLREDVPCLIPSCSRQEKVHSPHYVEGSPSTELGTSRTDIHCAVPWYVKRQLNVTVHLGLC